MGFNDGNLQVLEDRLSASISVRGEIATVKGVSEEIGIIEKVFKEMIYVLNTTNKLTPADVNTIIDLTVEGIGTLRNFVELQK